MSIKRLTSLPGGKGIPLQLHSRMVAVGLKPIIYSVLNKHMGQQCQIRPHRTAQKIKSNVPKQETYPRNTMSLNRATRAVSIQPCCFFDADPRKWNKLWGTCFWETKKEKESMASVEEQENLPCAVSAMPWQEMPFFMCTLWQELIWSRRSRVEISCTRCLNSFTRPEFLSTRCQMFYCLCLTRNSNLAA